MLTTRTALLLSTMLGFSQACQSAQSEDCSAFKSSEWVKGDITEAERADLHSYYLVDCATPENFSSGGKASAPFKVESLDCDGITANNPSLTISTYGYHPEYWAPNDFCELSRNDSDREAQKWHLKLTRIDGLWDRKGGTR